LTHADGLELSSGLSGVYKHQQVHDPANLIGAREIVGTSERIPLGILYRNDHVPCYEDLRQPAQLFTPEMIGAGLENELDKFTIWPTD
jgi:2-oxoglutarate ferredoxin oxidoreductase subunit beta